MTRGSCRANQQHQLEHNNRIETPTQALDVQLRNRGAPCGHPRGFGVNSVKNFFQLRTLLKGS